jgi:peptidoglycan/xylan/chitin deacetylase (PgdA/CDA1 family)
LDTLKELGVKATFFIVGINALQLPETVKRIHAEGHTVASHTYSHANLTKMFLENRTELVWQVDENARILEKITGERPRLLRPPYGAISGPVRKFLEKRGYTVILWNAGCIDCGSRLGSQASLERANDLFVAGWLNDPSREIPIIINGLPDAGGIICMHDTSATTSRSAENMTRALMRTDGPFANPQGRRILDMRTCLGHGDGEL